MSTGILIIGCGGFGREVVSILHALNAAGADWTVEGFVDDNPSERDLKAVAGLHMRVVGTVQQLVSREYSGNAVVAIGSGEVRKEITEKLSADVTYPVLIHPDATVGVRVNPGPGTIVAAGARLSTNIDIGRHVQIDQNATVGHDSILGEFCRINPQGCISGSVHLGAGSLIGANSTILQGLAIGDWSTVGAGAVVVRSVPIAATVKGVPAR